MPWNSVEAAARSLGVTKTFEWWSGREEHVWKLLA
jgi:hypothetical protein